MLGSSPAWVIYLLIVFGGDKISLLDQYSDEDFINIVKNSYSMREISKKIGYSAISGDSLMKIRERIDLLNISCEHFNKNNKRLNKRTFENVFCQNSNATQQVLRRWYFNGKYSEYECSICGQKPFWNGKQLTLTLDHINGVNNDNELKNLRWICPNCDRQLPTFGSKNRKILKKHYYCSDCGCEISRTSKRCVLCQRKRISKNEIVNKNSKYIKDKTNEKHLIPPVERELLKNMIRSLPFLQIGKKYGVTDNAIRKWCKKYNLPYQKRLINSYSDEEWKNI